jgi:hypothetical protein
MKKKTTMFAVTKALEGTTRVSSIQLKSFSSATSTAVGNIAAKTGSRVSSIGSADRERSSGKKSKAER